VSPNSVKACEGAFTRNTLIINMLKCREGVKALCDFNKKEQHGILNNMLPKNGTTVVHDLRNGSVHFVQRFCTTCANVLHNLCTRLAQLEPMLSIQLSHKFLNRLKSKVSKL